MKYVWLFLMLMFFWTGTAQEPDSLKRPKIGLVLSGGGAKGMAHIGVLKALETYGIKPDFIGGTSMGAIVGSMYAAGYSADQIDSLFHKIAFDDILYNRFDRKYLNAFEKERGKRFIINFPFSTTNMSVQLPSGLSDSQRMFNLLAESLLPVSDVSDFSKLSTPFICMSTDIVTGRQVLFNSGYLPEAVNASALLPSVYKPIDAGYKLLLDGGIVNNYPVQEVRDLGADFIIGSDVQGEILPKDKIKNMADILDQIIGFGMYKEMPLKKTLTDLYIRPNISGIGITDFEKIDTVIARGKRATLNKLRSLPGIERLKSHQPVQKLHFKQPDSLLFDQIILQGQRTFNRDYILGKIGLRPHQKMAYKDFLDGINNLIGSDNFEKVHYRFKNDNGRLKLYIDLKERVHKASMGLGFHFNDLYKINVIANLTNKRIFTNNDMVSVDIIGGNYFRYNFDYLIDNGFRLSWGFHSDLHRFTHRINAQDLFAEENYSINQLDFNYFQQTNRIYFQGNLSHFLYLRMGLQHQYKKLYTYVFSGEQDEAYYFGRNHYVSNYASVNIDSRNDCNFPTRGLYFKLKWHYTWTSSDFYEDFKPFSVFKLRLNWTQKIVKNLYLQPDIQSGLYYGTTYSPENIFYIGGMNDFVNYDQFVAFKPVSLLSVSATKFSAFSLSGLWQVYKNHFISVGGDVLYYNKTLELLPAQVESLYGYHIGYGNKSFLGPFRLNFGRIPAKQQNYFNLSFGYAF